MNPEVRIWFQHCFLNVVVLHKLGISPNGWMVYFMENPIYKWMRTGGSPYSRTPPCFRMLFKHGTNLSLFGGSTLDGSDICSRAKG